MITQLFKFDFLATKCRLIDLNVLRVAKKDADQKLLHGYWGTLAAALFEEDQPATKTTLFYPKPCQALFC